MNGKLILLPIAAFLIVAGVAVFAHMHGASIPVLYPAGQVALEERSVIFLTLLLCSVVVIPVFVMLFVFAWKYRAGNEQTAHRHLPNWDHRTKVAEFVWWLVPSMIIAILAVVAWQSSHALDPYKPLTGAAPMTVEVVALDWKWLFIYPEQGIASVNLLELPVNQPVKFELTADAPMNSFWIPSLGGQIMVMPGMQTQLNLVANQTGSFNGFSGNISGAGFSGMAFTAKAVPQDEFDAWVEAAQQSGTPLTSDTYSTLAATSTYNPVAYYAPVDPNLYTSIMMQFMMPGMASDTMSSMTDMNMNQPAAATTSMSGSGMDMQDMGNMRMPMDMPMSP